MQHEKLRQLESQRVHTLRLMLEKEQRYVDSLRSEIAKSNDTKRQQQLNGAERRVQTLQKQLENLTLHAEHEVRQSYYYYYYYCYTTQQNKFFSLLLG